MVGRVTAVSGSCGTCVYQVQRYSTVPPWASKLRAVDVFDAALVLLAGLAAGTINAIIGSGTLITFPVLLAAGFAPVVANQTSTLGLVPGSLAAVLGSRRDLAGHGRRTARYAACSLVGSATGAALLLSLPAQTFETVVPLLIAGALVLIVLQPRVARAVAERRRPGAAELGPVALVALTGAGVYGGYFGAAQGIMLFAVLATALPDDLPRVNVTRNLLAATVNAVSALVFVVLGDPDFSAAALIAVGATAGGVLGARVGRRLTPRTLRVVIVLVGLAAIAQLVL